MKYYKRILLKDGRECVLRNATQDDSEAAMANFILTHSQTDWLLSYPEECTMTVEEEGRYLQKKTDSENEIEILADVDGRVVGLAGIDALGGCFKIRHRAEFGVSIDSSYWGLGIGGALTDACIECAKKAGYGQLELEVVADNAPAIAMYKKKGFVESGRNPKGFRSRLTGWQELVGMRLDLTDGNET